MSLKDDQCFSLYIFYVYRIVVSSENKLLVVSLFGFIDEQDRLKVKKDIKVNLYNFLYIVYKI